MCASAALPLAARARSGREAVRLPPGGHLAPETCVRCLCGRSRHNANGSPVKYLNVSCYILHPFHVLSKVVLFSLIWYLRDRAGVRNVRWGATHGAGKAPALAWGRARAHMDMHEARYVDRTARWRCVEADC